MIIQFPNGAAIDSSVIASIHVEPSRESGQFSNPARIIVHVFKREDMFGFGMLGGRSGKPGIEHFLTVPMPSDNEANEECRRLVARWAGLPEPKPVEVG